MSKESEIRDAIQRIAAAGKMRDLFFPAVVKSVEGETCTISYIGLELDGVRLGPVVDADEQSIRLTPETGSMVLVADLSEGLLRDLAIIRFSKIKKAVLKNIEIEFNGGENGGLVQIKELKDSLKSLKTYVEAINTALPSAFTAIGASTAAVGANGATSYNAAMAGKMITISEMENKKISH